MKQPNILVVGSFVMDQIASTEVFPREGQTVLGTSFHKAPGGKGANQAVQVARLGASVTLVGKLGRDANGDEMLKVCAQAGIRTDLIQRQAELASGCSVIVLENAPGGQTRNRIIVIPGANMAITPADVAFLEEEVAGYDLVMLQMEIPMEINELVAGYAHAKGVPVMLNPAPSAPLPDALLSHISYLSPNEHEAADLTGLTITHRGRAVDLEQVRVVTGALRARGAERVVVTLGEAGAVLDGPEGFFHSPCVEGVTAVDPTAAGDSFVGAFCIGACCGWGWEETLTFANYAAALTVTGMGAMPSLPSLGRVREFLYERTGSTPDMGALGEGRAV